MPNDHQPNSAVIADALIAVTRTQLVAEREHLEYLFGVDEQPRLAHLHPVEGERNDDHAPVVGPA